MQKYGGEISFYFCQKDIEKVQSNLLNYHHFTKWPFHWNQFFESDLPNDQKSFSKIVMR